MVRGISESWPRRPKTKCRFYPKFSLIIEKFKGGPVGLSTLATAVSESSETIEEVYEPFLIQEGFLMRTPRGREVTEKAYKHLGKIKGFNQGELF